MYVLLGLLVLGHAILHGVGAAVVLSEQGLPEASGHWLGAMSIGIGLPLVLAALFGRKHWQLHEPRMVAVFGVGLVLTLLATCMNPLPPRDAAAYRKRVTASCIRHAIEGGLPEWTARAYCECVGAETLRIDEDVALGRKHPEDLAAKAVMKRAADACVERLAWPAQHDAGADPPDPRAPSPRPD